MLGTAGPAAGLLVSDHRRTNKTADWLDEMNRTGQAERSLSNLRSVLGKLEDLFFRLLTAAMQFFDEATPGMESLLDAIRPTEGVMRTLGTAFGNAARARAT